MNYELAKKLKDAGFPSRLDIQRVYIEDIPVPTLSELVEACGDGVCFWKPDEERRETPDGVFNASNIMGEDKETIFTGSIPEEAVANLWLKLNEKNSVA